MRRKSTRPVKVQQTRQKAGPVDSSIMRRYGRAFALLAAYDRGEYELPTSTRR